VAYDLTCHTYSLQREDGTESWRACMPCDSAIEYMCTAWMDDDEPGVCDWIYVHGLNPRNPRWAHNEARRPAWIPPGRDCVQTVYAKSPPGYPISLAMAVPGVRMLGDHGDEA
jgi:hypothetical protein